MNILVTKYYKKLGDTEWRVTVENSFSDVAYATEYITNSARESMELYKDDSFKYVLLINEGQHGNQE